MDVRGSISISLIFICCLGKNFVLVIVVCCGCGCGMNGDGGFFRCFYLICILV